ncbi:ATP-binding protein [Streptomyces sp. NPDC002773]|uniref:ATP-binding protein n=1 Tax=Streptomyces sp. NPDC002773 TaxID=3154430 RepID=UPI0033291159
MRRRRCPGRHAADRVGTAGKRARRNTWRGGPPGESARRSALWPTACPGQKAIATRDQTFTDKRLCQAIVDRLTFEAHIIETGTQSFRLASTTAKRKAAAA